MCQSEIKFQNSNFHILSSLLVHTGSALNMELKSLSNRIQCCVTDISSSAIMMLTFVVLSETSQQLLDRLSFGINICFSQDEL